MRPRVDFFKFFWGGEGWGGASLALFWEKISGSHIYANFWGKTPGKTLGFFGEDTLGVRRRDW